MIIDKNTNVKICLQLSETRTPVLSVSFIAHGMVIAV